jgi:hypothetical protein
MSCCRGGGSARPAASVDRSALYETRPTAQTGTKGSDSGYGRRLGLPREKRFENVALPRFAGHRHSAAMYILRPPEF